MAVLETGTVIWFNNKRGFGYIKPDNTSGAGEQGDIFVHWQNIKMQGFKTLSQGQKVIFVVGANHKGLQAEDVEVVNDPSQNQS